MAYTFPKYIQDAKIDTNELRFPWDDWKASDLYTYDSDEFVKKMLRVTTRAQIAMGIGIYEWIVWRFRQVNSDMLPYHLAEAAWLGISKPFHMQYVELDRGDWTGPVDGPLWCAMTWMVPMIYYKQMGDQELESGLAYLPRLAMHVLPSTGAFEKWLDACSDRLLQMYEAEEEDPFGDLFEEEDHGGPMITRECLNPDILYDPDDANAYFEKYSRSVDYTQNPILTPPEKLNEVEEEYCDHCD